MIQITNEIYNEKIEKLLEALKLAKEKEDEANKARIEIEKQILEIMPQPEEGATGTTSMKLINGTTISVVRKNSYKVADFSALEAEVPNCVKIKSTTVLDVEEYERIRDMNPNMFNKICHLVTVSSLKPSLTIKMK